VAAIGSPLQGNDSSLSVGVVSAVGRSIAALTAAQFQLVDAIQTDAPIPALTAAQAARCSTRGRVIRINAQIRTDSSWELRGRLPAVPIRLRPPLAHRICSRTVASPTRIPGCGPRDLAPRRSARPPPIKSFTAR
jgi:hypothetical protein